MTVDTSKWSGEGEFTARLVEHLRAIAGIALLRVEDAPATRAESAFNFVSNEVFVGFASETRREPIRRLGVFPGSRATAVKALTLAGLERVLTELADVGPPDYGDDTMLQYLRTERIVPPYQTRGYKLVELVRIYELDRADP